MKKSIVLFLSLLLILNLFVISTIKAENTPATTNIGDVNPETGLPSGLESAGEITTKLTDEQERSNYLKQEWGKILANNKYFGPVILGYERVSPVVDPVSKYTTGLEPSLTWIYILTLILWIAFVVYILRVLELTALSSKWVQYVVSIGMVVIISITGVTKKIAEYIINTISLLTTWWMQLIIAIIVIVALVIASMFSKNLQEVFKAMKKNRDKAKEELRQAKLERRIRVAEASAEGLSGK